MKIHYYLIRLLTNLLNPNAIKDSYIDKDAKLSKGNQIVKSNINMYSYIGFNCTIIEADIGKFCSIADNTIIGGKSHPISWVSTSPLFYSGRNIFKKNFSSHVYNSSEKTKIGNDVWIGSNSLIKAGISVGDGAIIGMGSVVTKNVEPYTIVAGNPAKEIRKRFTKDTINKIISIQWWEMNKDTLEEISKYSNNIEQFIINCSEKNDR